VRGSRLLVVALLGGCVYFNAMYDANREYDAGMRSLREQSDVTARVRFDSVIAKTGRLIESHPGSKYADDAALLKTRSELYNQMWESAVETSVRAEELTGDSKNRAVAVGLRGIALGELGAFAEADSLLSVGLSSGVDADDEALFLFHRGLARQGLGQSDEAAMDLEAAASSVQLSLEGRLTLSIALRDIGEYDRSADLAGQMLATVRRTSRAKCWPPQAPIRGLRCTFTSIPSRCWLPRSSTPPLRDYSTCRRCRLPAGPRSITCGVGPI